MSPAAARSRGDRGPAASPPSDAYTGMLGISLIALIIGCILLGLEWMEYPQTKPPALPNLSTQRQAQPPKDAGP